MKRLLIFIAKTFIVISVLIAIFFIPATFDTAHKSHILSDLFGSNYLYWACVIAFMALFADAFKGTEEWSQACNALNAIALLSIFTFNFVFALAWMALIFIANEIVRNLEEAIARNP